MLVKHMKNGDRFKKRAMFNNQQDETFEVISGIKKMVNCDYKDCVNVDTGVIEGVSIDNDFELVGSKVEGVRE